MQTIVTIDGTDTGTALSYAWLDKYLSLPEPIIVSNAQVSVDNENDNDTERDQVKASSNKRREIKKRKEIGKDTVGKKQRVAEGTKV